MTELILSPETLIGPVAGLALSVCFAFMFFNEFKKTTERLFTIFEADVKACEERYRQVLDELLKLKS